jgi:hypothetical protein
MVFRADEEGDDARETTTTRQEMVGAGEADSQQAVSSAAILRRTARLHTYPIERCPADLQQVLRSGLQGGALLYAFECYLQVSQLRFQPGWRRSRQLREIARGFLGALHSPRFIHLTNLTRYRYVRAFTFVVQSLEGDYPELQQFKPSRNVTTPALAALAFEFEGTPLAQEAVEYWSGWPATNIEGREYWLPFAPIFRQFGPEWTRQLHSTTASWLKGTRAQRIPGLLEFSRFIEVGEATPEDLKDVYYITKFWRQFWDFYKTERGRTTSSRQLNADWRNHWRHFAHDILPNSGLLARGAMRFPGPSRLGEAETALNVSNAGGEEPLGILLVEVPRTASDSAALELLIQDVPKSLDLVRKWADAECRDLFQRYRRRRSLAKYGVPRMLVGPGNNCGEEWKVDRGNPDHLANAAATFARYGYGTSDEQRLSVLYPTPLTETAKELGLPVAGSLLPFAAQLVLQHPEITPSFLEHLDLHDKNGKCVGLRRMNGCAYLVGKKNRKKMWGEQRIKLTWKTLRIVEQVILITHEARQFLKKQGKDDWRALFITTSKGFGQPRRQKRFATDTSGSHRLPHLVSQFEKQCGLTEYAARLLVRRFSLRSLRATVGVSIFIKTHSEEEMATALGHDEFEPVLLVRYLPKELLAFFRARWVAAFQTNLIVEVTLGTGYELAATGFPSYEELNEFMENNAFKRMKGILEAPAPSTPPPDDGSFYFNANEETLTLLCCAVEPELAAAPLDGPATYWAEFAVHMLPHLDSRRGMDPALDSCLDKARSNANAMRAGGA